MPVELTVIIILLIAVVVGIGFELQRSAYSRNLERNNRYQQLLAMASQLVHDTPDEGQFLADICQLICRIESVRLAWIGRPGPDGEVTAVASYGEVGYLEDIHVSVIEDSLAGQGPMGKAWRSGKAIFDTKTLTDQKFGPWRALASKYQLVGIHALPIRCDSELDSILAVYFGPDCGPVTNERLLFERLANDLATGISKIREHQHNRRLATALAQISEAVFILDLEGRITWFNDGFLRLFGFPADIVIGSSPSNLLADPKFAELHHLLDGATITTDLTDWEALHVGQTGQGRWVHVSASLFFDDRGTATGLVVVEVDLTDEKAAIDAELRLLAILDYTSDGVGITDRQGKLIYLNNGGRQLIGLDHNVVVEGMNFLDLIADVDGRQQFATSVREASISGRWEGELNIARHDGAAVPLSIVMMAHRNSTGHVQYISAIARSILDQKEREDQLSYLAEHDPLTGLPNRRMLDSLLNSAIVAASMTGSQFAVGVIDLDDFKPVNDRFGHHTGDELLVELGQRLKTLIGNDDAIVRLAGDEFVVILNGLGRGDEEVVAALDVALGVLHRAVETPFELAGGHCVSVEMSIGIALFPDTSTEPDVLLREADAALYIAKQGKRQRFSWWTLRSDPTSISTASVSAIISPYGASAAGYLQNFFADIDAVIRRAAEVFDEAIASSNADRELIANNSLEYDQKRKLRQTTHLSLLLSCELEQANLISYAEHNGTALALAGLSTASLVNVASIYRTALTDTLNQINGNSRDIQKVLGIIDRRIEDDLATELAAMAAVSESYFGIFANPLPSVDQLWVDIIQPELDMVANLPGIAAVCLARQGDGAHLAVESYSGRIGKALTDTMNSLEFQVAIDPNHPTGQTLSARAWREARILAVDDLADNGFYAELGASRETLAIRSMEAIPIQNLEGRPIGLLLLVGDYPGQFSSDWIGRFSQSLQQRWENLFYRIATPDHVLAREQAIGYRELLLTGGLRMYVQPIVDLKSGQPVMVEGLARLESGDRTIIGPDAFLAILGARERRQLFRMGLESLLAAEHDWRLHGLNLGLSINTDASTLNDPQLADWLRDTLARWEFSSDRLVLELLETAEPNLIPDPSRLAELQSLGVQLAIDDMGSGYSNWLRLVELPATLVKVDHKFVERINSHPKRVINLLGTLILTASDSGQRVIVEGIENPMLAEVATRLGADFGQGFGIARPMPVEELVSWALSYQHQQDRELHSLLGAMAYHWAFVHGPVHFKRGPLEDCALTRYFIATGMDASEGATLHRELHSWDTPPSSLVKSMTEWFEATLESLEDSTPSEECSPIGLHLTGTSPSN